MLVKDVMTRNPVTITTDMSIPEVKALMKEKKVSKLPVLDKSGALKGILTESDLNKASPSDATTLDMFELSYLLNKLKVEKIMTKKVFTTTEDQPVEDAAKIMQEEGFDCLPVMSENLVVGIITQNDLFRSFVEMFGASYKGVRATFAMGDQPGSLSLFVAQLARLNANIVSLVTSDASDKSKRLVTMRVTGISIEDFKSLLQNAKLSIEDIRNA